MTFSRTKLNIQLLYHISNNSCRADVISNMYIVSYLSSLHFLAVNIHQIPSFFHEIVGLSKIV